MSVPERYLPSWEDRAVERGTLFKVIVGLHQSSSGEVIVDGEQVLDVMENESEKMLRKIGGTVPVGSPVHVHDLSGERGLTSA